MKKIYKKPVTTSVELRNSESILSGSALHADGDNIKGSLYDDTQATGAGLVHEDNGWDIWDTEDASEE